MPKYDHYELLPDCVKPGISLLIVGINPGIHSAESRHHFAGPHNHFWQCLYNSKLIDTPLTSNDDHLLPNLQDHSIGLTNIVKRPTRAASELTKEEFQTGALEILQLIGKCRPKIVVFNPFRSHPPFRSFWYNFVPISKKLRKIAIFSRFRWFYDLNCLSVIMFYLVVFFQVGFGR